LGAWIEFAMSAKVQVLSFAIEERRYGLYLAAVDRVVHAVDVTPLPQGPEVIWGVIDVHGEIVPVFNVRKRFGLPQQSIAVSDQFVLARTLRRSVALVVDAVDGVIERPAADITQPDKILPHFEHVQGVIHLEDGMVLIHDLERFLSLDEERALTRALTSQVRRES
jgi:purine-binding chemotaxis protein CheW